MPEKSEYIEYLAQNISILLEVKCEWCDCSWFANGFAHSSRTVKMEVDEFVIHHLSFLKTEKSLQQRNTIGDKFTKSCKLARDSYRGWLEE